MNKTYTGSNSGGVNLVLMKQEGQPTRELRPEPSFALRRPHPDVRGLVNFNVTIRTDKLKAFRVGSDFSQGNLSTIAPQLFLCGVDVMKVKRGKTLVIPTPLAASTEALFKKSPLCALAVTPSFLSALGTDLIVALKTAISEPDITRITKTLSLGFDGRAFMFACLSSDLAATGATFKFTGGGFLSVHLPADIASFEAYEVQKNTLDWGYGGSAPSQLALAILLDYTGLPGIALAHYNQFKWDKVATWGDNWTLTGGEISQWLHSKGVEGFGMQT